MRLHSLALLSSSASATLVLQDGSIRIFGHGVSDCAYKAGMSYRAGDEIWSKSCNTGKEYIGHRNKNKAGKFKWKYDKKTGLIRSVGSTIKKNGVPFCWNLQRHVGTMRAIEYKQRVVLAKCDENSVNQQFNFNDGNLWARDPQWQFLCGSIDSDNSQDVKGSPIIFSNCEELLAAGEAAAAENSGKRPNLKDNLLNKKDEIKQKLEDLKENKDSERPKTITRPDKQDKKGLMKYFEELKQRFTEQQKKRKEKLAEANKETLKKILDGKKKKLEGKTLKVLAKKDAQKTKKQLIEDVRQAKLAAKAKARQG